MSNPDCNEPTQAESINGNLGLIIMQCDHTELKRLPLDRLIELYLLSEIAINVDQGCDSISETVWKRLS